MDERFLSRAMAPFARRISNMLARGTVTLVNAATKMQNLQVRLLADESKDRVEHFEQYGFTSHPNVGAECIAVFLDGDRSHGVVICAADRRYRLTNLAAGEVAIHDDQGQKVHLTRTGIVVDGGGRDITIQNAPNVGISGNLNVSGDIVADGDVIDHGNKSMADMRAKYNSHNHSSNGTAVPVPAQQM